MSNKTILIVSYYWFPYSGTGMYRISKFVKYLKQRGWEPVILTARKPAGNFVEEKAEEIYADIPVYRTGSIEPTHLLSGTSGKKRSEAVNPSIFYNKDKNLLNRLAVWVRLNFFVPDAKIGWKPFAVKKGKELIKKYQPALIFSTSPPPTAHLVARSLARWSGLPWAADFRDPWTNIYYYDTTPLSPPARKLNKRLEQSVLKKANCISLVNTGFFPDTHISHKAVKITNGYDKDDFRNTAKAPERNDAFTIRYLGTLKLNQYPDGLMHALKELSERYPEKAKNIRLEFFGNIDPKIQDDVKASSRLISSSFTPYIPHSEAISYVSSADMLLLIIGKTKGSMLVLSTKVFEYMHARKPVLGLGQPGGSAARLVDETRIGRFFAHEDTSGTLQYLLENYDRWSAGQTDFECNEEAIDQYDFKNLTIRLEEEVLKPTLKDKSDKDA